MAQRFLTQDGHHVHLGDQVWTANHLPWVITRVEEMGNSTWVFMEYDSAYEVQTDLDSTNMVAEPDFSTYIYKFHPADGRCDRMGCRYRPWGAR